jgi:hypothetical protein
MYLVYFKMLHASKVQTLLTNFEKKDKHSSLFCQTASDEESYVTLTLGLRRHFNGISTTTRMFTTTTTTTTMTTTPSTKTSTSDTATQTTTTWCRSHKHFTLVTYSCSKIS